MTNPPDGPPVHVPGQLRLVGEEGSLNLADALARVRDLEQEQRIGRAAAVSAVADAAQARHATGAALDQAVTEARAWGASWQEIADAAGITRQTAWKRWGIR